MSTVTELSEEISRNAAQIAAVKNEMSTHRQWGITHIVDASPRGFSNERNIIPITREFVRLAEEAAEAASGEVNGWYELHTWEDASATLRSRAGLVLRDFRSAKELQEYLDDTFLSAFAFDPDAFDLVDGQWVTHRTE